jgi:hypothetical protein
MSESKLNLSQQTSMLAFRSMRAADDLVVMGYIVELLAMEARPILIERLTGYPARAIKALHSREVIRPPQGRYPRALGRLIDLPVQHLELSIFLGHFRNEHLVDAASVTNQPWKEVPVGARAFIAAYREYTRSIISGEPFPPETMMWIAESWLQGDIMLERCRIDETRYIRSTEATRLRWTTGRGDCPLCRSLATSSLARRTLKSFEIDEAKANFARELSRLRARSNQIDVGDADSKL